eukprot:419757-Amphidinium_carterae.1
MESNCKWHAFLASFTRSLVHFVQKGSTSVAVSSWSSGLHVDTSAYLLRSHEGVCLTLLALDHVEEFPSMNGTNGCSADQTT